MDRRLEDIPEEEPRKPTEKQIAFANAIAKALHLEEHLEEFPFESGEYSTFISIFSPEFYEQKKGRKKK